MLPDMVRTPPRGIPVGINLVVEVEAAIRPTIKRRIIGPSSEVDPSVTETDVAEAAEAVGEAVEEISNNKTPANMHTKAISQVA